MDSKFDTKKFHEKVLESGFFLWLYRKENQRLD
jgi:hypothetical protein